MSVLETAVAVRHASADDVVDLVLAIFRDAGAQVEVLPQDAQLERNPQYDLDVRIGAEAGG